MYFNFKKIASAVSSALMVTSTVALAAAANYPAPFVSGSHADVAIIVGDTAASTDAAAAAALSADLGAKFVAAGGSTTTSATVSDDAFPLFTSGTPVYLNDSINVARTSITDDDLPAILAKTTFNGGSGAGDADVTQTIIPGTNSRVLFGKQPTSSDDPTLYISLGTSSSTPVYNTSITFDQAVNFTHADAIGETLELFGKEYTVSADTDSTSLVLYRSSERFRLSVGGQNPTPSKSVTVDGTAYTVEIVSGSDTSAEIAVTSSDGMMKSKEINEGDTAKVNGVEVSVISATENDITGISAEIVVGSQRITLEDGQNVQVGVDDTPLDGTYVSFTGSTDDLTGIQISTFAEDTQEDALLSGTAFADPVWGSFKLSFTGVNNPLTDADRDMMKVGASGDSALDLMFTQHGGKEASFDWLQNATIGYSALGTGSGTVGMYLGHGDNGNELIRVAEQAPLNRSMYAVVGNEDEGHLVELSTVKNSSDGYSDDEIKFTDVFDTSKTYDSVITSEGTGTVNIGGKVYGVTYSGVSTSNENVVVRLNFPNSESSGNQLVLFPTIETDKGAKVALYQPTNINMTNYDGAGTDVSGLIFPDGDGYNTVTTTSVNEAGNFTVGSTVIGNGTSSTTITAGVLTYNVSLTAPSMNGSITQNTQQVARVYLVDPVNGGNINTPALIVFEEEEDESGNRNAFIVTPTGSGVNNAETEVSTILVSAGAGVPPTTTGGSGAGTSFVTLESDDTMSQLVTKYGTLLTLKNPDSGQRTAEIAYPDDQVEAMVYVAAGDATVGGGSTGALGNIVMDASEVASVSNKNLIVVGGSCINTVAAKLLGSNAPLCGADFTAATQRVAGKAVTAGSWLVQSFESPWNSNKIALLVAGYEAQDTTNAANALKSSTATDTMVGKKYTGTTGTTLTPVTSSA